MTLAELQHLFAAAALGTASTADRARLEAHLQGSPLLPARQGVEAYRASVNGKLRRSLLNTCEVSVRSRTRTTLRPRYILRCARMRGWR